MSATRDKSSNGIETHLKFMFQFRKLSLQLRIIFRHDCAGPTVFVEDVGVDVSAKSGGVVNCKGFGACKRKASEQMRRTREIADKRDVHRTPDVIDQKKKKMFPRR
jgi:hypothetical protein